MSVINAEPYPFELTTPHTALLIIDMQRDFVEPGGFGAALGNNVDLLTAIVPLRDGVSISVKRSG